MGCLINRNSGGGGYDDNNCNRFRFWWLDGYSKLLYNGDRQHTNAATAKQCPDRRGFNIQPNFTSIRGPQEHHG